MFRPWAIPPSEIGALGLTTPPPAVSLRPGPSAGQNEPVVTADVGELARARRAGDLDTAVG
jgi:hypothetical protein